MTTEQTAQQLELAAQIIRTGHPWKSSPQAPDTDIYSALRDGFEIRPILVTFPDGRPFHNPDNLTAEQVGAGFRLTLKDESAHKDAELWNNYDKKWVDRLASDVGSEYGKNNTYRLPFSVPWPEPQPDPYADQKKTVPLGPEDVMPGSVIQGVSSPSWHWIAVVSVHQVQIKLAGHCGDIGTDKPTWEELKLAAKINRSLPLTGKWNPAAWEPCHKTI